MAALLITLLLGNTSDADQIRIAYFQTELSRDGPGLLLRDLMRGEDPQVEAVIDGGVSNHEPLTIVDCTSGEPEILRQGAGELID